MKILSVGAFRIAFAGSVTLFAFAAAGRAADTKALSSGSMPDSQQPIFKNVQDYKWTRILPDLGGSSPEISVVHIDPKTHATKLMIRTPKAIHIRKHWHRANETHTVIQGTVLFACEGQRMELGPGSFNFMPAKMVHEAWLPAGSLTFITVDAAWDVNWVEGPPTAADLTK
jgi:quercetin dioxygenase-like cupin family protein